MQANSQQTRVGRSISQESIGLKMAIIVRTSQLSSSDLIRPLRKIGIRAGTSVMARTATPIRAKVLVQASGWNIFPSRPVRAKTGRNERMVISTEKKIGRPTVRQAGMMISSDVARDPAVPEAAREVVRGVLGHHDRLVLQDADVMAIPARLMMFDGMPKSFIIRKLNRIASGRRDRDDERAAQVPHDQQDRRPCR